MTSTVARGATSCHPTARSNSHRRKVRHGSRATSCSAPRTVCDRNPRWASRQGCGSPSGRRRSRTSPSVRRSAPARSIAHSAAWLGGARPLIVWMRALFVSNASASRGLAPARCGTRFGRMFRKGSPPRDMVRQCNKPERHRLNRPSATDPTVRRGSVRGRRRGSLGLAGYGRVLDQQSWHDTDGGSPAGRVRHAGDDRVSDRSRGGATTTTTASPPVVIWRG